MPIADYRARVKTLLKDSRPVLTDAELDGFLADAIRQYDRDVPRWTVVLVNNVDPQQIRYPMPAGWINHTSQLHPLHAIENPIDKAPPDYMTADDHFVVQQVGMDAFELVFVAGPPIGNFRVTFSIPHVVDGVTDTVRTGHFDAVAYLAASYACRAMAGYYADTQDPTIDADVVDYRGKSREWTSLANELETLYHHRIQGDPDRVSAASVTQHMRKKLTWGAERIWHPNIWR